jgi:hypothetical protein
VNICKLSINITNPQVAKHIRVKCQDKDHHGAKAEFGMPSEVDLASLRAVVGDVSGSRASSALAVAPTSSPHCSSIGLAAHRQKKKPKKPIVIAPKVDTKVPLVANMPQASQTLAAAPDTRKLPSTSANGSSSVGVPRFVPGDPRAKYTIAPTLMSATENKMAANGAVPAAAGAAGAQADVGLVTLVDKATSPQKTRNDTQPGSSVLVPSAASPSAVSKRDTSDQLLLQHELFETILNMIMKIEIN